MAIRPIRNVSTLDCTHCCPACCSAPMAAICPMRLGAIAIVSCTFMTLSYNVVVVVEAATVL